MMAKTVGAGIGGMAVYVPQWRVSLEAWCGWTGGAWDKIRAVVGHGFRVPGPDENVYTMAATAALRLIRRYGIDPRDVGHLALGTESSTDNAAGAVIVRGMLDRELERLGMPRLSRRCEVPELKHACLGGIYALKGALRYVRADGRGKKAIVVCGDIAEYERGSSGEPTQGAGAVAMLVESEARMVAVDLDNAGSASDYRGPDFRKPMARFFLDGYAAKRQHDFPVFSGKYSTYAYLDETATALDALCENLGTSAHELLARVPAVFFHRPYRMMPLSAAAFLWARAIAKSDAVADRERLATLCAEANVTVDAVRMEARTEPDLYASVLSCNGAGPSDPYPALGAVAGALRKGPEFSRWSKERMTLGAATAMELGNLYTASLPAWLAAGLEEAAGRDADIGAELLAVGYGSGDAAEALLLEPVPGWRDAARRIGVADALSGACDLERAQYEALHDGRQAPGLGAPRDGFAIARVGDRYEPGFQDLGVEYYAYANGRAAADAAE
jgi:hydroxymethylglutaryl-CoA synthase